MFLFYDVCVIYEKISPGLAESSLVAYTYCPVSLLLMFPLRNVHTYIFSTRSTTIGATLWITMARISCDLCAARFIKHQFRNISELKRHIDSQHLDKRPFKCDLCPARFKAKYGMYVYTRSNPHRGEALQVCGLQQGLHAEARPQDPHEDSHRREAEAAEAGTGKV